MTVEDSVVAADRARKVRNSVSSTSSPTTPACNSKKALLRHHNEDYDWVFDVNVRGVFWGASTPWRRCAATVAERSSTRRRRSRWWRIRSCRSTRRASTRCSDSPWAGATAYAIDGVRCNCVCPGDMQTPMIERYWEATGDAEKAREEMASIYPAKKIGQPAEVAQAGDLPRLRSGLVRQRLGPADRPVVFCQRSTKQLTGI